MQQVRIVAWLFVSGIIIGLTYDIFRITRRIFKIRQVVQSIEDILFFVVAALVLFFSIFETNGGELRWFEFVASGLGLSIYMLLFSRFVVVLILRLLGTIIKIFLFVTKILFFPFVVLFKFAAARLKIVNCFVKWCYGKLSVCCGRFKNDIMQYFKIIEKNKKN